MASTTANPLRWLQAAPYELVDKAERLHHSVESSKCMYLNVVHAEPVF